MYGGGTIHKPRSARIISYAGLLIPSILIVYGLLIQSKLLYSPRTIDSFGFLSFSFLWIFLGVIQFLFPSKSRLDSSLRLIAYHLLAGSYLVFISGIFSPIMACWLILTVASYAYFSRIGFWINILSFAIVIWTFAVFWNVIYQLNPIYYLIVFISITITGYVIITVYRYQEISRKELLESKAQESLQRDRVITIVNNLADAVLSTDMNGVIRVYNAASLNLLDTNNSLNGHHIDDILPLIDQSGKEISIFKELRSAKTVAKRDDLWYVFDADDKMRLEITFSPIRSSYSRSKKAETHDGYIIIMRDITKSKSLEEERDEFISVISHELRTPITIAEGTISNVQVMMQHPDATKKMLTDAVNVAHEQIIFLASMVNDLSTLSRAERGVADNAEDIDVRELAHELHKKYSEAAKAKKLHLNLDLSAKIDHIFVSRLYLEELIQNLITNAIKYTKKGSVTIIVKQKSDQVTFSVKDTGIGISKSDQQKVFAKFFRSEDYRTRESSGTGLGLYVAAKLAHKIGTKITLTSRLNFGSTFSIKLPIKK
ncbi:MAG TPA: ATP-binding protein [Candidatus Saccharimonadales bacterium]|nr:ATP-binding protein [Candidatus Saccharimonadales bacterium]